MRLRQEPWRFRGNLSEVVLLDVLEVLVGSVLDFLGGSLVTDDDAVRVELQGAYGPPLCDGAFDGSLQGAALGMSIAEDEYFACIHDSAYAYGEGGGRHVFRTSAEESAVGDSGVCGEGLLACAAVETAAGFVESNMAIGTYAADEKVDAPSLKNHLLVVGTLGDEIGSVAIEDVNVLAGDVDVVEEVGGHEAVVAFRMALGQSYVLVHVEGEDVLEGDAPCLVGLYESAVHANGATAGGQAKNKGMLGCGLGGIDAADDVLGCPLGHPVVVGFDDYSHCVVKFLGLWDNKLTPGLLVSQYGELCSGSKVEAILGREGYEA